MISFITGEYCEKQNNQIVIDVNGIGYDVFISSFTADMLPPLGEHIKILTYMQVKEDGICLFGFLTQDEKDMFLKLISVSGVGPKGALGIMSGLCLSDLIVAIKSEDIKSLASIKGLGRKTAERIIVDLKDEVSTVGIDFSTSKISLNEQVIKDATQVLISLGLQKNEAYMLAKESATENCSAEDIIGSVLKSLGR